MSTKIKIPSLNIRCDLSDLFHKFMNRKNSSYHRKYSRFEDMDDEELMFWMSQGYVFNDMDDDFANFYDDDDDNVIWPQKKKDKKKKSSRTADDIYEEFWNRKSKRKHRKGKKARLIDINEPYSGEEEFYTEYEEVDDNGVINGKEIYYYPDYHNKDNRLEFSTLKSFNEFCDENGYSVPEHVANDIMYRRISHTCLRPDAREYGMYEIIAEESYGVMVYEVCDPSELGDL